MSHEDEADSASLQGDVFLPVPSLIEKKAPGLMVLICSEPGSCLSAEISHSNVLHSRAVATAHC